MADATSAGLDDLARRVLRAAARAAATAQPRRHAPGGAEAARPRRARGAQAARPRCELDDDARAFAEMRLESLPPSTAAAVNELSRLRLASRRGPRRLREDQGPARPRTARPALRRNEAGAGERDRRGPGSASSDMLNDLNDLLEKHARGEDTSRGLRRLHGTSTASSSPRIRRTSTSCIDSLAQRSAAAQRMLNSMTPEQRDGAVAALPPRRSGRRN